MFTKVLMLACCSCGAGIGGQTGGAKGWVWLQNTVSICMAVQQVHSQVTPASPAYSPCVFRSIVRFSTVSYMMACSVASSFLMEVASSTMDITRMNKPSMYRQTLKPAVSLGRAMGRIWIRCVRACCCTLCGSQNVHTALGHSVASIMLRCAQCMVSNDG